MSEFDKELTDALISIDYEGYESADALAKVQEILAREDVQNNEKWKIFLESEVDFYNGDIDASFDKTEKAIELDKKCPKENQCYYFLYGLGVLYEEKDSFVDAEKNYTDALKIEPNALIVDLGLANLYIKYDIHSKALYRIGKIPSNHANRNFFHEAQILTAQIYFDKGNYKKANETLRSIENDCKRLDYIEMLALSYVYIHNYDSAINYYSKLHEMYKNVEARTYIQYKLSFLEKLKNSPYEKIDETTEMIFSLKQERLDIIESIFFCRNETDTLVEQYKHQYEISKETRNGYYTENYLLCLKGWSSSTPELSLGLNENAHRRGGGFFIHYNGFGIVIDPGLNFVENLHENNLFINDIDVVIVTHNHIDHSIDLKKIFDYSYQLNHKMQYYLDHITAKEYIDDITSVEKRAKKGESDSVHFIYPERGYYNITLGTQTLRMNVCETQHNCEGSFAFTLCFDKYCLGYSSDTGYTDELGEFFKNCNYLIANISETDKDDITFSKLKSYHLGAFGVYKLIQNNNNADGMTCFLSEFWGGFADLRLAFADILNAYISKDEINVIPMDIGMLYLLDDKAFICGSCGRNIQLESCQIARFEKEKKLVCICENCTYALKKNFTPIIH